MCELPHQHKPCLFDPIFSLPPLPISIFMARLRDWRDTTHNTHKTHKATPLLATWSVFCWAAMPPSFSTLTIYEPDWLSDYGADGVSLEELKSQSKTLRNRNKSWLTDGLEQEIRSAAPSPDEICHERDNERSKRMLWWHFTYKHYWWLLRRKLQRYPFSHLFQTNPYSVYEYESWEVYFQVDTGSQFRQYSLSSTKLSNEIWSGTSKK